MSITPTPPPKMTPLAGAFSFVFDHLLGPLQGSKTYLAAVGLWVFAGWQATHGDILGAIQSFLAGLTAAGLRSAIAKTQ